jgi:hypothetical protein
MKTVWIYVDTRKQVGDRDHLKVFANSALADEWFVVNEPEGVELGRAGRKDATDLFRVWTTQRLRSQSPRACRQ